MSKVKERPMIFTAESVNGILAGRKTQTRRVMKTSPKARRTRSHAILSYEVPECPYGVPGDRLYVKEAWSTLALFDDCKPSELDPRSVSSIRYAADGKRASGRYRHAWFMPRWASRLTLEIVSVRVERLQDISREDAMAEGWGGYLDSHIEGDDPLCIGNSPVTWYRKLWDSINGKKPGCEWAANCWVWRVEFRKWEESS